MSQVEPVGDNFYNWLEKIAEQSFNYWEQHKVGILGTISIHLTLAIALLIFKMNVNSSYNPYDIEVNFKNEYLPITPEEKEMMDRAETVAMVEALRQGLEADAVKNIAVDAAETKELNPTLQDDRGTNASDLYSEAGRLKEQMTANKDRYNESLVKGTEEIPNTPVKNITPIEEGKFKGPAVISYFLEGRKAIELPVPAYKCQFGGQVVVDIEVGRDGKVIKADIDTKNSITDDCINTAAIKAALESNFTVSTSSTTRQKGSITYLFVPQ
ncbi:MAG: hypothetical protein AB9846_07425 [Tenuifilaceae bacterium]